MKGERPKVRASVVCISKAARFHKASLGKIKLEMMPTSMAVRLSNTEPICSIQPPIKARPNSPKTSTPLARVERIVPPKKVSIPQRVEKET